MHSLNSRRENRPDGVAARRLAAEPGHLDQVQSVGRPQPFHGRSPDLARTPEAGDEDNVWSTADDFHRKAIAFDDAAASKQRGGAGARRCCDGHDETAANGFAA